jgi:hypothetical protein
MGQAKQRGTREERVAMAIERRALEDQARAHIAAERERNMTPDQRRVRIDRLQKLAVTMGLAAGAPTITRGSDKVVIGEP